MNAESQKLLLGTTVAILAAVAGFWLASDVISSTDKQKGSGEAHRSSGGAPPRSQLDSPNPPRKSQARSGSRTFDFADLLHGVPKERIVRFSSEDAYRRFLSRLDGSGLRLLGNIDRLRAVRIGYDELADLDALLGEGDDDFSNYYVAIPQIPQVDAQPGALGFGRTTLEWLGITSDNSSWGEGVRIAMLDTGIGTHAAFPNGLPEIDLITGDGPPVELHGHGTAVASLIVGSDSVSQGIAPGAELLSVRIADADGSSNSFLLAEGILAAVDAGVQIINISMGSYGDSSLVRDAIDYARENSVVIVAAAGNDGLDSPAFPAAYEGVISVGAVDANGQHLNFSNSGDELDLGAPGFEIVSAWPGDNFTSFSGTSASAPIVVGTIAAAMTEVGPLHVDVATQLVLDTLNAAGAPGKDPQFGGGVIDVGRVMESETSGIYDAAVASNWYVAPEEGASTGTLFVTVENRGTESLTGTRVNVLVDDGRYDLAAPTLQPGQEHVFQLPVNAPVGTERVTIQSSLTVGNGLDRKSENDSLSGEILLITPDPPADPGEEP